MPTPGSHPGREPLRGAHAPPPAALRASRLRRGRLHRGPPGPLRVPGVGPAGGRVRELFREDPPRDVPDGIRGAFAVYAASRGKPRYGDKTPIHPPRAAPGRGLSRKALPARGPGRTDVACSYLQSFGPRTVAEAAIRWKRAVRRGTDAGRRLGPQRYLEVRYEALVAHPECAAEGLLRRGPLLRTGHAEVFRGRPCFGGATPLRQRRPAAHRAFDWRREMDREDVATFEAIAGGLLKGLGYPRGVPRLSPAARARAAARWSGARASVRVPAIRAGLPATSRPRDHVTADGPPPR